MFANSQNILAVICFLEIFATNMASNQVAKLKDDILDLNLYTYRAIKDAKQIYCQRVPLLSTDDCDQFISRTLKPLIHLPQLSLSQKVDVKDEKIFHDLLVNMTTTISASLILVKHEMNQEHKILCQPAITLGVKCHYPNKCNHVSNDHNAIFYCKLHFVHSFLENFQRFLSFKIPGTVVFPTVMDDFISWRKMLFNIFRRWYTITLLDNTLTQTDIFQSVMKS